MCFELVVVGGDLPLSCFSQRRAPVVLYLWIRRYGYPPLPFLISTYVRNRSRCLMFHSVVCVGLACCRLWMCYRLFSHQLIVAQLIVALTGECGLESVSLRCGAVRTVRYRLCFTWLLIGYNRQRVCGAWSVERWTRNVLLAYGDGECGGMYDLCV